MAQGRSTMSGHSENAKMNADDADDVATLEIAELQNQFRLMKLRDQRTYEIQAREQILKQEQEIGRLMKQQEELRQNLAARKSLQRKGIEEAQALLQEKDTLEGAMENEKQHQKELQREILSVESKLAEMRKVRGSSSQSQSSKTRRSERAMRTLESRVQRAANHFSDLMTKNAKLKEELNSLYLGRDHFQKLRKKLINELQKVRKSIGEITKLSTDAYDSREETLSKMAMLREKAIKDLAQYNADVKELERVIAHEFNLKNFINTKSLEQTTQLDDKMAPEQLSDVKEPGKVNSGEQCLDNLKEAFDKLQIVMGEENLDLLVNRFIQAEDRNLALLKFVNEQNSEAVKLKDQINKVKEEMQKFHFEGLQREQKHHSLLKDTEEKLKRTECQAESYENQAGILSKILDEIKAGVSRIFSEIGCDQSAVEDKLGFSSGVTENNIMTYLDLVEEKTNELLTVQAFLKFKDLKEDFNPEDLTKSLLGQTQEVLKQDIAIHPSVSSLEHDAEESSVTDEDERPLSDEELRRKIIKHRTENSAFTRSTTSLKMCSRFSGKQPIKEDGLP